MKAKTQNTRAAKCKDQGKGEATGPGKDDQRTQAVQIEGAQRGPWDEEKTMRKTKDRAEAGLKSGTKKRNVAKFEKFGWKSVAGKISEARVGKKKGTWKRKGES